MSQEARVAGRGNYLLLAWVVVPVLLLGGVFVFLLRGDGEPIKDIENPTREQDNFLAQARNSLGRQADLPACRSAVLLLNSHLRQDESTPPPRLADGDAQRLTTLLRLQPDDVAELNSPTFTPLDVRHLEACFLLRDAARSLELPPMKGSKGVAKQTPLTRAAAGFDWVIRQVRLLPPDKQALFDLPAPTSHVLRRGSGSALERALVFLALLEQFGLDEDDAAGLQGCLVYVADEKGQKVLWACGVAVGGESGLHLFDPRLGLPVPGPGGKGIAKLDQAGSDGGVLGQLKFDLLSYDITTAQAKAATLAVVCPLSAASARMKLLQDKLLRDRSWRGQPLPPQVRVRLAEDPTRALATIQKVSGKSDEAAIWPPGATLIRKFFSKDDGGTDTGVPFQLGRLRGYADGDARVYKLPRERIYAMAAVPWEEFPGIFRDPEQFRFDVGLGERLRRIYASPFLQWLIDPNAPREQIVRGKFPTAVRELVQEEPLLRSAHARLEQQFKELLPGLSEWVREKAVPAYAAQLRAKDDPKAVQAVESLFKWRGNEPIAVLMTGAMAGPRAAEVMYQLALARHEQAIRLRLRLELAAEAGLTLPGEAQTEARTWGDAENYWRDFVESNPGRPGQFEARLRRAETQKARGQPDEAKKTLADAVAPSDLEKLAALWLAR